MMHQRYCTRQHKLERSNTFSRLRQLAMDLLAGSLKVEIAAIFNQASAPQSPWFQSINMLVTLAYHCIWRHSACWHWSYLCKWKHLKVSTDNAWILIWIMAWSRMQVLGVGIQWPHWINILNQWDSYNVRVLLLFLVTPLSRNVQWMVLPILQLRLGTLWARVPRDCLPAPRTRVPALVSNSMSSKWVWRWIWKLHHL